MAQGGGPLIVAGREHAAYCFEVLSCYFSGESPAAPRFTDHHWCVPPKPAFPGTSHLPHTDCILPMVAHSRLRSAQRAQLGPVPSRSPLFVTWNKVQRPSSLGPGGYRLRGCIGTLEARHIRAGAHWWPHWTQMHVV